MLGLLVAGYGGVLPWVPQRHHPGIFYVPRQQVGVLGDVRSDSVREFWPHPGGSEADGDLEGVARLGELEPALGDRVRVALA
jgi:hypothetical protein